MADGKSKAAKSHASRAREIVVLLVRYATVSNGIALSISLTAVSQISATEIPIIVSKFPIWCFFVGLVLSVLVLAVWAYAEMGAYTGFLLDQWQVSDDRTKDHIARIEALRGKDLPPELEKEREDLSKSIGKLANEIEKSKKLIQIMERRFRPDIRNYLDDAQYIMLALSFTCFLLGTLSVIGAIVIPTYSPG